MLEGRRFYICEDCSYRVAHDSEEPPPFLEHSPSSSSTPVDPEPYALGAEIEETPAMIIHGGWRKDSGKTVRIQAFKDPATQPGSVRKTTEILRQIQDKNLLHIEDAFLLGTTYHLVCEDFASKNLEQEVQLGALRAHLLHGFFSVLSALKVLHSKELVHGDLSPQNILVGLTGEVKLANILLLRMDEKTLTGFIKGRPAYSAPEIWKSPPVLDARSDIFSLGSLLYYCVTGGEHPPRVLSPHRIPKRYSELILKCRSANPQDRFASVAEVEKAVLELSEPSEIATANPAQHSFPAPVTPDPDPQSTPSTSSEDPTPEPPLSTTVPDPHPESIFSMVIKGLNIYFKPLKKTISSPFKSLFLDLKDQYSDAWDELRDETGEIKRKAINKGSKIIKKKDRPAESEPQDSQIRLELDLAPENQEPTEVSPVPDEKPRVNALDSDKSLRLIIGMVVFAAVGLVLWIGFTDSEKVPRLSNPKIAKVPPQKPDKPSPPQPKFASNAEGIQIEAMRGEISSRKDPLEPWKPLNPATALPASVQLRTGEGSLGLEDKNRNLGLFILSGSEIHIQGYLKKTQDSEEVLNLSLDDGSFEFNSFKSKTLLRIELTGEILTCRSAHFKIISRRGKTRYKVKKGALKLEFKDGKKPILFPKQSLEVVHGKPGKKQRFNPGTEDWKIR